MTGTIREFLTREEKKEGVYITTDCTKSLLSASLMSLNDK